MKAIINKKIKDNNVLLIFLLILIIISAVFVSFTYSYGLFHYDLRDYYEGVFWAQASLKAHNLINRNYIYNYLVPLGSNVIMSPFVYLFGPTLLANQMGMVVFFVIYLLTALKLSGSLYKEIRSRLLFVICVSLFVFTYIGDNLLHHILGYGIAFVCYLGILSCIIDINNRKRVKINYLLLSLYSFWSAANGVLSVALSNIAVLFALFATDAYLLYKKKQSKDSINYKFYITIGIITAVGFLFYIYCNSAATTLNKQNDRFVFDNITNIVMNMKVVLLSDYFKAFFIAPEGTPFFSLKGLFVLLKFFFSGITIVFPIYHLYRNRKDITKIHVKFLMILLSSSFIMLICLFQYFFSKQTVVRFLFNGLLSLFLICAVCFVDFYNKNKFGFVGLGIIAVLVLSFSVKGIFQSFPNGKENMKKMENVVEELNNKGLKFGYTCTDQYNKQINLFTGEDIFTSVILYDSVSEKYYIEREFCYDYELERPTGINEFFVLADSYTDYCLSENCKEKVDLGDDSLSLYIFDMSSFDKIIEVE